MKDKFHKSNHEQAKDAADQYEQFILKALKILLPYTKGKKRKRIQKAIEAIEEKGKR